MAMSVTVIKILAKILTLTNYETLFIMLSGKITQSDKIKYTNECILLPLESNACSKNLRKKMI